MISAVILSAGLSARFGSPKALADFQGEKVITRLQRLLIAAEVSEVIVVLGASADEIRPFILDVPQIRMVVNQQYQLGQTSSFQAALRALKSSTAGILLLPVDYPMIKGETIAGLLARFRQVPHKILVPAYEGRKGHPPIYPSLLAEEFLSLPPSMGINTVNHRHQDATELFPCDDPGVIRSFNTKAELTRMQALA
jgi:molybdenum cofactor cytidylyltransferase